VCHIDRFVKSTLLRALNRLEEPAIGRVRWLETPLADIDVPTLRRWISLVAQQPVLLAERVLDELRVGQPKLTRQAADELLERVGLTSAFARRLSAELSGGEAQRMCLARALAVDPRVLLLDEPTTALDGVSASLVEDVVQDFVTAGGTVVMASHDASLVVRVAQHVLLLDRGRLMATGEATEIASLGVR
jgi:putative ABC transport system ATP-binding protein